MNSLTAEQWAEIDARILAGEILQAIKGIMTAGGVGQGEAKALNRARYAKLRAERGEEFLCDDEEYWSNYSECPFDADL